MTSPTQLKYLDAIGIPVWVSRDIVVTDVKDESATKPSVTEQAGDESVESILEGLNQSLIETPSNPVNLKNTASFAPPLSSPDLSPPNSAPQQNEIARTSNHIVYAGGNSQADWMIIGESPEINDDHQNQPYAGETGVLLCNMLRAVGLENPRQSAYLVNVIKSSMQVGNVVDAAVTDQLREILTQKIGEVKPKIILLVGQLAAQNILQSKEPLVRFRGKVQTQSAIDANMIVTYYPSYLLSKPMDKRKAWDDLKLAMKTLESSQ